MIDVEQGSGFGFATTTELIAPRVDLRVWRTLPEEKSPVYCFARLRVCSAAERELRTSAAGRPGGRR